MALEPITKIHFASFPFINGIGHGATTECCPQTGDSNGVSETGAMVHIIGAQSRSGQFLCQIVLLIGNSGGSKYGDAVRAFSSFIFFKPGRQIQSFSQEAGRNSPFSLIKGVVSLSEELMKSQPKRPLTQRALYLRD